MSRMPQHLRDLYTAEMAAARAAQENDERWRRLERAHIVSQPFPWPHTRNHVAMLVLALRQRDRGETIGQVVRIIVAASGSALGRYPDATPGARASGS